jgi:hypothetical protein|tara:strand:- start:13 stop:498 length:486 start_codon:yes stop_codon:yes gene_type:complete
MEHKKYLILWSLLPLLLLSSGCSIVPREKEVIVQTVEVEKRIPLQTNPKQLQFNDVYWHVVTEANFDEFIEKFKKENGNAWVFYAISVRSYESMALNMAELKRYIEQQKQIIVYYEEAIKPKQPSVEVSEETEKEKSKFLQKIYDKVKPNKKEEVTDGTVQ